MTNLIFNKFKIKCVKITRYLIIHETLPKDITHLIILLSISILIKIIYNIFRILVYKCMLVTTML